LQFVGDLSPLSGQRTRTAGGRVTFADRLMDLSALPPFRKFISAFALKVKSMAHLLRDILFP
jgi:hypothetical protein